MSGFLFVYSTLWLGCAPKEIAHATAGMRLIGEATVAGELYDLGHYPGAVLSNAPERRISGLLFELPNDESVLRGLRAHEEFGPGGSRFVRVCCQAELAAGDVLPCWIYVYAGNVAGMRRIESGRWSRRGR